MGVETYTRKDGKIITRKTVRRKPSATTKQFFMNPVNPHYNRQQVKSWVQYGR